MNLNSLLPNFDHILKISKIFFAMFTKIREYQIENQYNSAMKWIKEKPIK